jgi:hypothetical protein
MKREFWTVVALALAPLAGAQEPAPESSSTPPPRSVEARAEQELKRMGAFLAGLPHFALEAEETFDELPDGQLRRQLTNVRRVAVERPNHLAADATGDTLSRASWYDGRTVTVLDKEHNVYATIEAPTTIDATFDKLTDEYGVVLPLVDLLYSDPYAVLMEGVTYGRYLGLHQAAGVACHHLAFSQETIEWQIWIDAGEKPLPRKLVISYVQEPGEPQYSAVSGEELYLVVDAPKGAVPAIPGEPGAAPQAAAGGAPAPAAASKPKAVTLTVQPNTPLTVRTAAEVSSGTAQAGQRFQGNLDADLVADNGRVVATRGTRVYGRVVAAKAGTGTGGAPQLTVELTDLEVGGRVVALSTAPVSFTGEAKKAGKKVLGAAALGAGIGGMIDGGEGAAWGAGAGAVVGVAAAKNSPGNQVAVAAGTALEFRLTRPLSVDIVV